MPRFRPARAGDAGSSGEARLDDGARDRAFRPATSRVPRPWRDQEKENQVIWVLVLILALLAIGGGIAVSKLLFLVLIVAIVLALLGGRSAA